MEENLGFRYPSVTADFGYESEEAYTYLRSVKQKPYIKPQTYEKWKKRSFKQDISKRENMGYDEKTDTYTCHAGKALTALFVKKQKSKSGYESEVTVYECENCRGCPYKEKCTRAKGNKRLYISKSFALDPLSHIYGGMPPVFIWHMQSDQQIKSSQALNFALKLFEYHVPHEIHIFSSGVHGCALADKVCASQKDHYDESCEMWPELLRRWLKRVITENTGR